MNLFNGTNLILFQVVSLSQGFQVPRLSHGYMSTLVSVTPTIAVALCAIRRWRCAAPGKERQTLRAWRRWHQKSKERGCQCQWARKGRGEGDGGDRRSYWLHVVSHTTKSHMKVSAFNNRH